MKKILGLTMALMMGVSVAGAVSLKQVENNADRYVKIASTDTTATYLDKKSVELESRFEPFHEIEFNRIVVDKAKNEITKFEEKHFFDMNNKNEVRYVIDEEEVYDLKGHELFEKNHFSALMQIAKKGEQEYKRADKAFEILYGKAFSKK